MQYKNLRRWLFENDMSQCELASILGVSPATISLIVRGLREPNLNVFRKLCEITQIDPKELL